MKPPIEMALDGVTWRAAPPPPGETDGLPYVTHEGDLQILGLSMKVYRLSNGQAVISEDGMRAFLNWLEEGGR